MIQGLTLTVEAQEEDAEVRGQALAIAREIVEQLPVGVLGVAADGMVVIANQAAYSMLSPADRALVTHSVEDVLPPAVREAYQSLCENGNREERLAELPSGKTVRTRVVALGTHSNSEGRLLVLVP